MLAILVSVIKVPPKDCQMDFWAKPICQNGGGNRMSYNTDYRKR